MEVTDPILASDGRWNCIRQHCVQKAFGTQKYAFVLQHVFRLRLDVSSRSGNVSLDDFYLSFAFAVTYDTQTNLPADNFFVLVQIRFIKIPIC